jgi:hypothetical protein
MEEKSQQNRPLVFETEKTTRTVPLVFPWFSTNSYQNGSNLQKTASNLFFVVKKDSFPSLFPFKNEKAPFD